MTVFLSNAEYKNSLAILRALNSKGIPVEVGGVAKRSLCFFSRIPEARVQYPSPKMHPRRYISSLVNHFKRKPIDVFFPVGLDTFTLASKYKAELEKVTRVPVVDYEIFEQAHDKNTILEFAKRQNIPTPDNYLVSNTKDALKHMVDLKFPIVVKARKGTGTSQVRYANSKQELVRTIDHFSSQIKKKENKGDIIDYSRPIIQEYLPGDIYDVLVFFVHGKLRAMVVQKRILCYPADGGSGALNITVDFPILAKYAHKLMAKLKWHGVAMIEFKLNSKNQPCLLEVNPKFWGTSGLAISAEMNFPYLLYKTAMDGDIPPQFRYLNNKLHGWPFPMGVNHLWASTSKKHSLKLFLKLFSQKNSTDLMKADLNPFSWQMILTAKAIMRNMMARSNRNLLT